MPAYKNKNNNTWMCKFAYKDVNGSYRYITKRGFLTKREALEWENEHKRKINGLLDMRFSNFIDNYLEFTKPRNKISTYYTKESIIKTHIEPFFRDYKVNEISTQDVVKWQNNIMKVENNGKKLSKPYLRRINTELNTMFNYAMKYFNLTVNPVKISGSIGGQTEREMKIWTPDEFERFVGLLENKPIYHVAFGILYYLGIREGELLALTPKDFDFEKKELTISKTYHRFNGQDLITSPKTKKSNRTVVIPDFLCTEIKNYILLINEDLESDNRLFPFGKTAMPKIIKNYSAKAGLERIRIHDLRHSHVSLLIEMGYSAVQIAERLGHESIHITYRYAHLFPNSQKKIADSLNELKKEKNKNEE